MKDTGPDAVPPCLSFSIDPRSGLRLTPAPEPYLKSIPSVLARERIESIVSSIELMKHADPWGFSSTPTLNQTGELNAIRWVTSR